MFRSFDFVPFDSFDSLLIFDSFQSLRISISIRLPPRSEGGCETELTFVSRCRCNHSISMRSLIPFVFAYGSRLNYGFRCVRSSIIIASTKDISYDNFGCSVFKRYTWKKSTLWSLYMLAPRCRGCKIDAEIQVRAKMIDVKFQVQVTVILSVSYRSLERGGVSEPSQAQATDSVNPRSTLTRAAPR